MMMNLDLLVAPVPYEVLLPVGGFVATSIFGMAGMIAWMIKQEYARSASRSREDALIVENASMKEELARQITKNAELEKIVIETQHERDYERARANDAIRKG